MELRTAEEDMKEILGLYSVLRRSQVSDGEGPMLANLPEIAASSQEQQDESITNEVTVEETKTLIEILSMLESLKNKMEELKEKADKFRRRSSEKDAVTGAPRYGANTLARVTTFLQSYDELSAALVTKFGQDEEDTMMEDIGRQVQQQEEAKRQLELKEEQARQQKELERQEAEQQARQTEEQRLEDARLARLRENQELAQRAQAARQARQEEERAQQRQREELEAIERAWVDGITVGPQGVREQLARLREATATDSNSLSTALNALHTLFSQIAAHPEQANFRRVRCDHEGFNRDIGRHEGGKEVLIAAGFRLDDIDGQRCFISTEPNIETEMDAWSEWFDLMKKTLEVIEEELIR